MAMMKDWIVLVCVSIYGMILSHFLSIAIEGLIQATYDTVLPIWLASEDSVGGFELNKKDLGWVLSFVSPMQMGTCKAMYCCVICSITVTCYD